MVMIEVALVRQKTNNKLHLLYAVNKNIIIDPTYSGMIYYNLDEARLLMKLYTVISIKRVMINEYKDRHPYLRLSLYNCISTGKHLLGMTGIYFTCQQFFNKIKE